nr:hypothetical protein [Tanacetum cinerariifolium]
MNDQKDQGAGIAGGVMVEGSGSSGSGGEGRRKRGRRVAGRPGCWDCWGSDG